MSAREFKRKKKWIDPRIQNRFALSFLTVAGLAVLVQSIVLNALLFDLAKTIPEAGQEILAKAPILTIKSLALTLVILAPTCVMIGVRSTFSIVGPLFRFRSFLRAVIRGEHPEECRIRGTDDLQDMCELLNQATESIRSDMKEEKQAETRKAA